MKSRRFESVIQYFWLQQSEGQVWKTLEGNQIHVKSSGIWNLYDGPDFLNAQWTHGEILEQGNVEIHLKTSDWQRHGHSNQPRYREVGIHVVACNDMVAQFAKHTVSLKDNNIDYATMLDIVKCQNVRSSTIFQWAPRQLRFERWVQDFGEERAYWIALSRAMGCHIHGDEMETWAKTIPWNSEDLFLKNQSQITAFFLKRGGFIKPTAQDPYGNSLMELSKEVSSLRIHWKRKSRPNNRPILRLVQLASVFAQLKRKPLHKVALDEVYQALLNIQVPPYWQYHSLLGLPMNCVSTQISVNMAMQMVYNAFGHLIVKE